MIEASFNVGDVTNTKTSLGATTAGAGGIIGRGDPVVSDVYNVGTVTAEKNAGGILGSYDSSYKTTSLTRVYQAGNVVCVLAEPVNVGAFVGRGNKTSKAEAYYDSQIVHSLPVEDGALTTVQLAAVELGDAWVSEGSTLPVLARFSDDDYARLYSAAILLDPTDHAGKVSRAFRVSAPQGVDWSGDSEAFSFDGDNVAPVAGVIGDHELTATLGNLNRKVTLTLTGTSGVNEASSMSDISVKMVEGGIFLPAGGDYSVYNVAGTLLLKGKAQAGETILLPAGVYVVNAGSTVVKAVVR